ncbi:MAG: MerR family transcriptional regulator [Anaerolineae bacterium]
MPSLLTIGRIAKLAEVNIETVRYYERRGLLPAPPRTVSSYRLYGDQSVARLRFIKQAQALGFTLEEIGELLALRVDAETSCDVVRQRAERKMADVAEKIRSLAGDPGRAGGARSPPARWADLKASVPFSHRWKSNQLSRKLNNEQPRTNPGN